MARIDAYLRSIERVGARGALLISGKNITLKFPAGDRQATQAVAHEQLVAMVREIAPASAWSQLESGRGTTFEFQSNGTAYQIGVTTAGLIWTVQVDLPAAPEPTEEPPPPPQDVPLPEGGDLRVERTQYDFGDLPVAAPEGIDEILQLARHYAATEVILQGNAQPMLRVGADLVGLVDRPLLDEDTLERDLDAIAISDAKKRLAVTGLTTFTHATNEGRIRVRWCKDQAGSIAQLRLIPSAPFALERLGAPPLLSQLIAAGRGLFLVCGHASSGRTTSVAALVDYINASRNTLIATIEVATEFVHERKRSIVSQRTVGVHCPSVAAGIRGAVAQGANVIATSEVADAETALAILEAVEGGCQVLAIVTAGSVEQGLARFVDYAASDPSRPSVQSVQARLARRWGGGLAQGLVAVQGATSRRSVFAVLSATHAAAEAIASGDFARVASAGQPAGAQTFAQAVADQVAAKLISSHDQYHLAPDL